MKNFHTFISKQVFDDRQKSSTIDQSESLATTRRSILYQDRRISRDLRVIEENSKEQKEEDLLLKENNAKKDKYYDNDEVIKYRRSMLELPNLHDKNKKTKFKYITPEFIEFLFQILKSIDVIQKIFSSSVPQESVVTEFLNVLNGFKLKNVEGGKNFSINREDDYFHILIEGAAQKVTVRETFCSQRKYSMTEYASETSIIRRSKLKNKTVTEKGKLICFEKNLPILVNSKQSITTTLKSIGECTFILLDKIAWTKFLNALQKLEEKYLVGFIKHCTTININTYTNKEKQKNKEDKIQRKKFLQELKFPTQKSIDDQNETDDKQQNEKRGTTQQFFVGPPYKLFTLSKDQKMKINNQDVHLIIKGSLYLTTDFYSMIISEGSIINSSILLDINYREIKVKALAQCSIAKIILDEIYFRKQDEKEFVAKLSEIQEFRCEINGKSNKENVRASLKSMTARKISNETKEIGSNQNYFHLLQKQSLEKNSKFQPRELRLRDMSFLKGTQNQNMSQKKQRISRCKKFITEPESHQTQLARKVAVKYANNFCIFEKIVESQQKVIQAVKINKIKKLFPIQDLFKNLDFSRFLKKSIDHTQNKHKKQLKTVNFSKNEEIEHSLTDQIYQENGIENMKLNDLRSSRISNESSQSNKTKKINVKENLETLRKRRLTFGKTLMEKKKKQKAKFIDNLFEINSFNCHPQGDSTANEKNSNSSLNLHKERIKEIVSRNTQKKLKDQNSQRSFCYLRGSIEQNVDDLNLTQNSFGKRSKYNRQFLVTDPNYAEIKTLQKAISGQKLIPQRWMSKCVEKFRKANVSESSNRKMNLTCNSSVFTEDYLKLRKRTTRRIQTTMLTGRIRQAREVR